MPQSYTRLFLTTPVRFDLDKLQEVLAATIAAGDVASLLIRCEDNGKLNEAARLVTGMAQRADIAVLIKGDVDIALACKADGVEVDGTISDYDFAREKLGDDKIIGAYCGADRHAAMLMAEAGADYVAFANQAPVGESELIAHWWARVFEVACVQNVDDLEQARAATSNLVDFISPAQTMWSSTKAGQQAVKVYNDLIGNMQIETA